MTGSNSSFGERVQSWGRLKFGAAVLAAAAGLVVLLIGIAVAGPEMLAYTLFGTVPLVLGLLGVARLAWAHDSAASAPTPASEPMEELKRRYAAGEIEDDTLERKVETLLSAEGRAPRNGRRRDDAEQGRTRERERDRTREREPERSRR